jgi:hypothetical protein
VRDQLGPLTRITGCEEGRVETRLKPRPSGRTPEKSGLNNHHVGRLDLNEKIYQLRDDLPGSGC